MNEWVFGLADQGRLTLNKVAGIKYSIGQISNDVTKAQLIANADDNMRSKLIKALGLESDEDYTNPYIGLKKDHNNVISISYEKEKRLYDEFMHCRQSKEDFIKFLSDYCKVGRMRQELTIDYAKKLTDLSGIDSLLMENILCMGMQPATIKFDKREGVTTHLPSVSELIDKNPKKIIVPDPLWETKGACINYAQKIVESGILEYLQLQEPVYQIEDAVNAIEEKDKIFYTIKNMYKDLVGAIKSEDMSIEDEDSIDGESLNFFNDGISRLENMLRAATPDMAPEDRALNIKACARRGDEESENSFYLHLCKQEYLLMLESMGLASVNFIGEKLYDESDEEHRVHEGETLNFVDGECEENSHICYIEKPYTGALKVFRKDKRLYAGKSLRDAIKVPNVNNKASVQVMMSYYAEDNVQEKYQTILNRKHNKTKIIKKNDKYFMIIRSIDDERISIPVFVPKALESWTTGRYANIVGTRLNLIHGIKTDVYTMYIDIDFVE